VTFKPTLRSRGLWEVESRVCSKTSPSATTPLGLVFYGKRRRGTTSSRYASLVYASPAAPSRRSSLADSSSRISTELLREISHGLLPVEEFRFSLFNQVATFIQHVFHPVRLSSSTSFIQYVFHPVRLCAKRVKSFPPGSSKCPPKATPSPPASPPGSFYPAADPSTSTHTLGKDQLVVGWTMPKATTPAPMRTLCLQLEL